MLFGVFSSQRGSAAPPVGRTFNVGTGSGTLEVNAASGAWAPIQPNDTFVIQGGTYDYVLFQGFNLTSGNVYVTCTSTVTLTGYGFYLSGSNRNIVCDFLNKVPDQKYGLVVDGWDHGVTIDENGVGNYRNVTIKGVRVAGVGNGKRVVNHAPPAYTGSNPSSENLVIEDWLVELPNSATPYLGISIGGDPFTSAYSRLNINPVIRRVEFKGTWQTQYPCFMSNAQNGLMQQITFDGTNQQVTANLHARLAMIHGQGTIEQVFAKNHMGNAAGFWGYYRTGQPNLCIARNILAQNSTRYSAVEVQGFADYNQSGVGANASYYIGGITADTLDTENYFTGCAADVYATFGGAVAVDNAISVNGHSNTSGGNNVINSYNENTITPTGSGVYANRAAAGLNTDLVPQTGSVLIGAGVANVNLTTDYAGKIRSNPPTRGGLEP